MTYSWLAAVCIFSPCEKLKREIWSGTNDVKYEKYMHFNFSPFITGIFEVWIVVESCLYNSEG